MTTRASGRSITVGVDGSPNSMAALQRATAEADRRRALLNVVHVIEPERNPSGIPTAAEWVWLRDLVAQAVPPPQLPRTRLCIVGGEPGTALVDAARNSELLVIGARRHSEAGNPLGGDTVPVVLLHAPCEVTVCADHHVTADPAVTTGAR